MNTSKEWSEIVQDKNGRNIVIFTTLSNGIKVADEDLGDSDALLEAQDY